MSEPAALSSKCVCIVDCSRLFFTMALRMSAALYPEGFGRVLYWSPWDEDDPSLAEVIPGDGFRDFGIERCDDYLAIHDQIDLFCYPAIGKIGEQLLLESIGKRVIGAKRGQDLEVFRSRFRKLQSKLGMDVPEHVSRTGVSSLSEHLPPLEDKFLKIDRFRHDLETTHWRSWAQDSGKLDKWAVKFGPLKELVRFLCEDSIKTDIEDGGDFFCIDGKLASHCVIGIEEKNKAYAAFLREYSELDPQIKEAIEPLLPTLAEHRYRNFISTEQRKTNRDNFLTDLTTRLGFPSGSCQLKLYGNAPQLLYEGGTGNLIDVEPGAQVCLEVMLDHCDDLEDWRSVHVTPKLLPWLNPINGCLDGDVMHFAPNDSRSSCIGSINGVGDTVEEAVEHLQEVTEMLKGQPVHISMEALPDVIESVHIAQEEHGVEFTEEELPDPDAVANLE